MNLSPRVAALLARDFDAFTTETANLLIEDSVSHKELKATFEGGRGFLAFQVGSQRAWVRWVSTSKLTDQEKVMWSGALFEALGPGSRSLDALPTRRDGRKRRYRRVV